MRDFQFKVWDNDSNRFLEIDYINFNRDGSIKELILIDGYDFDIGCVEYHSYTPNDVEILQYSGIKDKNGKKIYEGDIIEKYISTDGLKPKKKKIKLKIYFEHGEFKAKRITKVPKSYKWYNRGVFYDCKIIGNIYENPELLKEV
jgi:uncharacterized phage protein (TIGR01671 family)